MQVGVEQADFLVGWERAGEGRRDGRLSDATFRTRDRDDAVERIEVGRSGRGPRRNDVYRRDTVEGIDPLPYLADNRFVIPVVEFREPGLDANRAGLDGHVRDEPRLDDIGVGVDGRVTHAA